MTILEPHTGDSVYYWFWSATATGYNLPAIDATVRKSFDSRYCEQVHAAGLVAEIMRTIPSRVAN